VTWERQAQAHTVQKSWRFMVGIIGLQDNLAEMDHIGWRMASNPIGTGTWFSWLS